MQELSRVTEAKQQDRRRRDVADLFTTWHAQHGGKALPASDLAETVRAIADPQNRGRQYLVSRLDSLVGNRIAGLMLTRIKTDAKWSVTRYAVERVAAGTSPASHPPLCPPMVLVVRERAPHHVHDLRPARTWPAHQRAITARPICPAKPGGASGTTRRVGAVMPVTCPAISLRIRSTRSAQRSKCRKTRANSIRTVILIVVATAG